MVSKGEFIAEAIRDTQATIRALDIKIGATLTALIIPFSFLGRIWAHFKYLCSLEYNLIASLLFFTFFASWILSIACLMRALSALDNPAKHIIGTANQKGSFYSGGLFEFGLLDSVLNRKIIKSSKDFQSFLNDTPNTEDEINKELAFEQVKLIYIRDIKIYRLNIAYRLASLWLTLSAISFLLSKFHN